MLCHPRVVASAKAKQDHGRLEGVRKGTDDFGSRAVQITLGWLTFPSLGCVHMSTEDENPQRMKMVLPEGRLISRSDPITGCVGQCQTVAKKTSFKLN